MFEEYCAVTDLGRADQEVELGCYQQQFNYIRQYGALGKTPVERCVELAPITPLSEEAYPYFDPIRERENHRRRERLMRHSAAFDFTLTPCLHE